MPGADGTWEVDGRASMEDLRAIGVVVPDDALGESVGAFVVERLGRLPRGGDKVELARNATAEITALARRRVTRMRVVVRKLAETAGEADGSPAGP